MLHSKYKQLSDLTRIVRSVSRRYNTFTSILDWSASNILVNVAYVDEDGMKRYVIHREPTHGHCSVCCPLWIASERSLEDLVNNIKLELILAGIDADIDYTLKNNECETLMGNSTITISRLT